MQQVEIKGKTLARVTIHTRHFKVSEHVLFSQQRVPEDTPLLGRAIEYIICGLPQVANLR